jgi:hypothetical protein
VAEALDVDSTPPEYSLPRDADLARSLMRLQPVRITPASLTAHDAPTAANYHSLLWLAGVAFIASTSIAAWCVVAMMLTGLHR